MLLQLEQHTVDLGLIVFDKDGTLVDVQVPWGRWAEEVAAALPPGIVPDNFLRRLGWDQAAGRIAPETPLAIAPAVTLHAAIATWLYDAGLPWTAATVAAEKAISAAIVPIAPPVCPLQPLFQQLIAHGVHIAIVTSDDRAGVERDLGAAAVLPYIGAIIGADAGLAAKPVPDAVLAACASAGVPPSRTVVVGDSVADLLMGRAAGVALTVGVLTGSGTREILAPHADVILPGVCSLTPR